MSLKEELAPQSAPAGVAPSLLMVSANRKVPLGTLEVETDGSRPSADQVQPVEVFSSF